jgi:valine--pyruvate aminotransferase
MKLSDFGQKMSADAGINRLMDDLGRALADEPPLAMFGGGNPAIIPAMTKAYKRTITQLLRADTDVQSRALLGMYDIPRGNASFIRTITDFINRNYDLGITEDNVAITAGSQTGYFMLFNLLAGRSGNKQKKILFPIVPEYIGYVDQGIQPDMFVSIKPKIEKIGEHDFKYRVDFRELKMTDEIAGICISRPTNPSGNVITDDEVAHLGKLAKEHDVPLMIDNAYGQPFPDVVKADASLFWNDNTVLSASLSKVGMPASRVGIFIGPKKLMGALSSANAIIGLASPSMGQFLAQPLIESDEILKLSKKHIRPYYFERAEYARSLIGKHFPEGLPWRLHAYEGSYFFWLWCEGAKMSSKQMYDWLKKRGVLVVPGEYFFPGQDLGKWKHSRECLRINFARPDKELQAGIPILAKAIVQAYK